MMPRTFRYIPYNPTLLELIGFVLLILAMSVALYFGVKWMNKG